MGEFEAESKWKDPHCCSLPQVNLSNEKKDLMEELHLSMADPGDYLLTRYPMNEAYLFYLQQEFILIYNKAVGSKEQNIYEALHSLQDNQDIRQLIQTQPLKTFVLADDVYSILEKYNISRALPLLQDVIRVNSKVFSTKLRQKLDISFDSAVVRDIEEFQQLATQYIKRGKVVVKEPFGVSGRGSMIIDNFSRIQRLVEYFQRQNSKKFELILEPFLDNKIMDFSCHVDLASDGTYNVIGFQGMQNNQYLSYVGSYNVEPKFYNLFDVSAYMSYVDQISKHVMADGYFGPICIDSMLLSDNRTVPLVEINARMSMGRYNLMWSKYLSVAGKTCQLMFVPFDFYKSIDFSELQIALKKANILYSNNDKNDGIVPLAPNLWINSKQKTRLFYYLLVYDTCKGNKQRIISELNTVMKQLINGD